jgi:hypothetical protein
MSVDSRPFYIGYVPRMPAPLQRFVRKFALALVLVGGVVAIVLVVAQQPFAASSFEFGKEREFAGRFSSDPYPVLLASGSRFLLVAPGKQGLSESVIPGQNVKLRGSLIQRGGMEMIEVAPASIQTISASSPEPSTALPVQDLGQMTLSGEIVDSKCFLGVMNPGGGKVHRDCAARCLSGGIPPLFVVKDAHGQERYLLLTGPAGRAAGSSELAPFAAEPVSISGRLVRSGDALTFQANLAAIRRL